MSAQMQSTPETLPAFCEGIQYFADSFPEIDRLGAAPLLGPTQPALPDATSEASVYQTLLAADALRYLTLQVTGSKSSGHPGGFASSADAVAALHLLGHRNMVTEVGHHAPGFYSAMFLDTSLEDMGIRTVAEMRTRFRERHGLLGHLSGAIPGLLAPAGPLGQGQHFAMAGAYLHRDKLFPVTIGDGGLGEPYIMSAFQHFATAYPDVTNYLPVLVWNGYSQEHHSMVSLWDNARMTDYWRAHGFDEVHLIDARDYADTPDAPVYADSTTFGFAARMAFTGAILKAADAAAKSALSGRRACLIVKQLKGAGVHATGAKSHNLYAHHTLDSDDVKGGLQRRALPIKAWEITRENFRHAGGGPAARVAVTETARELPSLDGLPLTEFAVGENHIPTTAFGHVVGEVGKRDPMFVVTNADGNEASGMANINKALTIRHPTADDLYFQGPSGQVYEPLNEDACAGLAVGVALFGGRSLWCSYESFAINGLPIWQTVTQAMAELRRTTPATVCLFTAGALEQGRNGWTHQRPGDRELLRRDDAQRQRLPAVPGRRQHDPGELRLGAEAAQQGHRHHRLEVAAADPRHPGAELPGDRRRRDGAAGTHGFAHRGVRGDRRHGAAAGVRRRREAGRSRHRLAHRRRGQPAPPVPPDRRAVGQRVGTRRPLHG